MDFDLNYHKEYNIILEEKNTLIGYGKGQSKMPVAHAQPISDDEITPIVEPDTADNFMTEFRDFCIDYIIEGDETPGLSQSVWKPYRRLAMSVLKKINMLDLTEPNQYNNYYTLYNILLTDEERTFINTADYNEPETYSPEDFVSLEVPSIDMIEPAIPETTDIKPVGFNVKNPLYSKAKQDKLRKMRNVKKIQQQKVAQNKLNKAKKNRQDKKEKEKKVRRQKIKRILENQLKNKNQSKSQGENQLKNKNQSKSQGDKK